MFSARSGAAAVPQAGRTRKRAGNPSGRTKKGTAWLVELCRPFFAYSGGIRTRKGPSVKKTCRRHVFSEERRSGCAASRPHAQAGGKSLRADQRPEVQSQGLDFRPFICQEGFEGGAVLNDVPVARQSSDRPRRAVRAANRIPPLWKRPSPAAVRRHRPGVGNSQNKTPALPGRSKTAPAGMDSMAFRRPSPAAATAPLCLCGVLMV